MPFGMPSAHASLYWQQSARHSQRCKCASIYHLTAAGQAEWPKRSRTKMHKPIKYVEKALTYAAGAAWTVFDKLNQISPNPGFKPAWSDKPLLKSWEKVKPPLG